MATAALVISLVALVIAAYNALAARSERVAAKKAVPHVGASTVSLDGDEYRVVLRVTNGGKANAHYLMAHLVSPAGAQLCEPVRSEEGLPADNDVRLTLRLPRASVPPDTPIVHALLAWEDAFGRDLRVSAHRVRLDEATESPGPADGLTIDI